MQDLHVRNVVGRYPIRGQLRSQNVVASVTEVARIYRIRLDDAAHPDMWLEITVEVELPEKPCDSPNGTT